ncbi:hypothetical protein [Sediminitomix flava]|uniref:2'-5' RNA ligase n=1 Tax=Sediminitomix flava TaxID=379075 RepID=A0A315YVW8_SEDFL|nr:hypothetical protein [Sediminitomix flava]PWJ33688.1 hypothetical protein BC781_11235 [Sediminitomix flava]
MIAIDIVMLLPEELADKAIQVNQSLPNIKGQYRLNKKSCFPHITIGMGVIEEENLTALKSELSLLNFPKEYTFQLANSYQLGNAIGWNIEKSNWMDTLHIQVMDILQKFTVKPEVKIYSDCLYPTPYIHFKYETINYLKNFARLYAFDNFQPHITIGLGNTPPKTHTKKAFISDGLALFHLGNLNTCVKMIAKL